MEQADKEKNGVKKFRQVVTALREGGVMDDFIRGLPSAEGSDLTALRLPPVAEAYDAMAGHIEKTAEALTKSADQTQRAFGSYLVTVAQVFRKEGSDLLGLKRSDFDRNSDNLTKNSCLGFLRDAETSGQLPKTFVDRTLRKAFKVGEQVGRAVQIGIQRVNAASSGNKPSVESQLAPRGSSPDLRLPPVSSDTDEAQPVKVSLEDQLKILMGYHPQKKNTL